MREIRDELGRLLVRLGRTREDCGGNLLIYRRSVNVYSWLDGYAVQSAMRRAGMCRRWSNYARSLITRTVVREARPAGDSALWAWTWAADSLAQTRVIYGQLTLTGRTATVAGT